MKKIVWVLLSLILFTGCSIASPITTVNQFLQSSQDHNFQQAAQLMIYSNNKQQATPAQLESDINQFEARNGKLQSFTVQNAIPLAAEELSRYGITEGNTVYYTIDTANKGKISSKVIVIKVDSNWKILAPETGQ